jgi:hypothetical protein
LSITQLTALNTTGADTQYSKPTTTTDKMMKGRIDDPDIVLHAAGWDYLKVPAAADSNYAITGNESQVVTLKIQAGDHCQAEPGTMMYLSSGIKQSGKLVGRL